MSNTDDAAPLLVRIVETFQLWLRSHCVNAAESLNLVINGAIKKNESVSTTWCWCCASSLQLYLKQDSNACLCKSFREVVIISYIGDHLRAATSNARLFYNFYCSLKRKIKRCKRQLLLENVYISFQYFYQV